MTQPTLLECAKDGDPTAIAALMNLTLEPKDVSANAFFKDDCLHVVLSAARSLNVKTSVAFVQRGILRLDVPSVQQVHVYGQRLETDQPDWVETFVVDPAQAATALEALSRSSTPAPVPSTPKTLSTLIDVGRQHWNALSPRVRSSFSRALVASRQLVTQQDGQSQSADAVPHGSLADSLAKRPAYLKLSVLVTLIAFMAGGTVALLANSYTVGKTGRQAGEKSSAIASSSQLAIKSEAERTRDQQQDVARNYLETMNKAQQTFYRQNNRFAATLEELERFAAVPIASRSDYAYKLTAPSKTQAQLTAVPKPDGLKSYTAAVAIVKPTNQAVAAICASQQAAKVPPLVFQSPEGAVQCPQ